MAFNSNDRSMDRILKKLMKLDLGALKIPGETPGTDTIAQVGRSGDNLFSDLDDVSGTDYYTHYFQKTKADNNDTGEKDW